MMNKKILFIINMIYYKFNEKQLIKQIGETAAKKVIIQLKCDKFFLFFTEEECR